MCAIYLKHGDELVEMVEQPNEAESVLQRLLADYPNLLAGDQDDEPRRRWLLVQRELGIAGEDDGADRWSIDHLFLDQDGVPTLVEVKRSSDTRLLRQVVGQLLDYAANASAFWSVEKIRAAFEARHSHAAEADAGLAELLGEDQDPERFWSSVGVNLKAGRLRLIFVADDIPVELRRIVEFLNEQMDRTEVLALEVRQYADETGARLTLVPRLIGATQAARHTKGAPAPGTRARWAEKDVFEAILAGQQPDVARRMIELYEFIRDQGARPSFGTGSRPSVTIWLGEDPDPAAANPVAIAFSGNGLSVEFRFVRGRRTPAEMTRLLALMREIPGARPYLEGVEARDFRAIGGMRPDEVLSSDDRLEAFKNAVAAAARPAGAAARSRPPADARVAAGRSREDVPIGTQTAIEVPVPDNRVAEQLGRVVRALANDETDRAAAELSELAGVTAKTHPIEPMPTLPREGWPKATHGLTRNPAVRVIARIYVRDGFTCVYCARRTIPTQILRLISHAFPDEFPYHPNWKLDIAPRAYWDISTSLDHIHAVSMGGDYQDPTNLATACARCQYQKGNLPLETLGWVVRRDLPGWSGLIDEYPALWERLGRPDPREHAMWTRAFDAARRQEDQ